MFKILSAKSTEALEQKVAEYDVTALGSLTISNGQYFIAILGDLKVKPTITSKEPEVKPKATPKKTTRKKAPAKKKPE